MRLPLLLLALAGAEPKLAVLPIDPGPLDAVSAAAIDDEVRAEAKRALGADGVLDPARVAEALGADRMTPTEAAGKLGVAVLSGATRRLEGALAVSLSIVSDSGRPLGTARLVGITVAEVREDAHGKVEKLVRTALGLTASSAARSADAPRPAASTPAVLFAGPGAQSAPAAATQPPRSTGAAAAAASKIASLASAAVDAARSAVAPDPPAPAPPRPSAISAESNLEGADAALARTIREVVDQVEAIRGLHRKAPLKVAIVGEKEFGRVLRAKEEADLTPRAVALERARWAAFGLAPPSADPKKILLSVTDEQVAGFYDPTTKSLTVRAEPPPSAGGPEALRLVLAHEIEHALQDQNFGFPDLKTLADDDARLARLAVYEGDAMATMIAFAARSVDKPIRPALAAAASAAQSIGVEQLLGQSGLSPELLQAPAIVREEMLLPYREGLALVAEVQRRGGWPLVDRLFQRPPQTTHQVLHPEAYLAGESPADVPFPRAPEGMQVVATGRMGELGTRVALTGCVEPQVARDFTRGWAGDAYTIVRTQGDSIGVLWSTQWSGEAKTFANLVSMQTPCWAEAAASGKGGWRVSTEADVSVEQQKAGFARGLGPGAVRAAAAAAVAFAARIPPPAPPLGAVPEPAAAAKGRVVDGKFVDPRLALEADVPSGFSADLEQPEAELLLRKPRPPAVAALSFVAEAVTPEVVDGFFQSAAAAFATRIGGSTLKLRSAEKTTLLGKPAQERSWDVDGTFAIVRVTVAPACEGRAFYAVLRASASGQADKALQGFVGSLRQSSPLRSPACAELE